MNFMDYCDWRGDLSFEQSPYNKIDSLIMAYLVYTDLRGVVAETGEDITVRDAAKAFFELHSEEECRKNRSFVAIAPFLLRKAGETERFGNIRLHHYVNDVSPETSVQFSAMCADLNGKETCIVYCGTDDTIVGWKEDLQMSYRMITSQPLAAEYLRTHMDRKRKYHICGHSKGGNLALYAACKCDEKMRNRILDIWDFDGPGLNEELFNEDEYQAVLPVYHKAVPESSVFGMIFNNAESFEIVDSSEYMIMQHAGESWQVRGTDFVHVDALTDFSRLVQVAMMDFLEKVNPEEREEFTEDLFRLLMEADIHTVSEFQKSGLPVMIRLLKTRKELKFNYKDLRDDALESLMNASRVQATIMLDESRSEVEQFLANTQKEISTFIETEIRRLLKKEEKKEDKEEKDDGENCVSGC